MVHELLSRVRLHVLQDKHNTAQHIVSEVESNISCDEWVWILKIGRERERERIQGESEEKEEEKKTDIGT